MRDAVKIKPKSSHGLRNTREQRIQKNFATQDGAFCHSKSPKEINIPGT